MRKNISLSSAVEERANAIIKARGFDGLSDLLAALVREEYERRNPPAIHPSKPEAGVSSVRQEELADQALKHLEAEFGPVKSQAKPKKRKKSSQSL